jgi:hypothetical protein
MPNYQEEYFDFIDSIEKKDFYCGVFIEKLKELVDEMETVKLGDSHELKT